MLQSMISKNYGEVKTSELTQYEEKLLKTKRKRKSNAINAPKVVLSSNHLSLISNINSQRKTVLKKNKSTKSNK